MKSIGLPLSIHMGSSSYTWKPIHLSLSSIVHSDRVWLLPLDALSTQDARGSLETFKCDKCI